MQTLRVLPPLRTNNSPSRNPTNYKLNSNSIKEQIAEAPNENDEIKIISRHTGKVEVKHESSLEGITTDDNALVGLKPIMKK